MLKPSEVISVLEFEQEMGSRSDGSACFGTSDPKELRPPFNLPETAAGSEKKDGKKQ